MPDPPLISSAMKRTRKMAMVIGLMITAMSTMVTAQLKQFSYPTPRKSDVVDDYFGTKVPDPYRWMEELDSKELSEWVAAENKLTFDYLERLPLREHFRQ